MKKKNIPQRPACILCFDSIPLATINIWLLVSGKGFCRLDERQCTITNSKLLALQNSAPSQSFFTIRPKYLPGWEKSSCDRCCASVWRAAGPPRWSTSRRETRLWRHTRALHCIVLILQRKRENAVCSSHSNPAEFSTDFEIKCHILTGTICKQKEV